MNAFDYEEKGKIWLETMNFCLEIFLKVDVHSLNLMIVTYPSICSHAHTEFHVCVTYYKHVRHILDTCGPY